MKNKLSFYLCLFLSCSISVYSQNSIKAEIEYEEAEKAFNANDYNSSLMRLNEAEKLLGKTNSKILYLKVISQNEIIKVNPYANFEILVDIRKNCDMFMKLTDKKPDMYDKYKEVYKIKQDLEIYPKSIADFNIKKEENIIAKKNEKEKENEAVREKQAFIKNLFERINFTFEADKPLDYYTSKYPDFDTFIKKGKKKVNGNVTDYTFKLGLGRVFGKLFRVELNYVMTKDNKVTLVGYTLFSGKNKDKDTIYEEFQKFIQQAKNTYGDASIKSETDQYGTVSILKTKELDFKCRILFSSMEMVNQTTLNVVFFTE